MITIGVDGRGHVVTTNGYILVADTEQQWHEHWQGIKIHGQPVMPVTVDVAAVTPSFPIAEWGRGQSPVDVAHDSIARARDAVVIAPHELQRELGQHPESDSPEGDVA